jgi:hypothetical protein
MVRSFQRATMALRYARCRSCRAGRPDARRRLRDLLHGDRVQAAAEAYIGLVEVGVGLIPAAAARRRCSRARWRRPDPTATCCRTCSACSRRSASRRSRRARRGAAARLPAGRGRRHDEPRAAVADAKKTVRWPARGRLSPPPPLRRPSRSAATCRPRSRSACTSRGARAHQRSRRAHRPARWRGSSRRRRAAPTTLRAAPARPRARSVPELPASARRSSGSPHAEDRQDVEELRCLR